MSSARLFAFAPNERGPSDFPRADVTDDVRLLLDGALAVALDRWDEGCWNDDALDAAMERLGVLFGYDPLDLPSHRGEKKEAEWQRIDRQAARARIDRIRGLMRRRFPDAPLAEQEAALREALADDVTALAELATEPSVPTMYPHPEATGDG